jgi:cytochrome c-type biogenesis protein
MTQAIQKPPVKLAAPVQPVPVESSGASQRQIFLHALAFVLGFAAVFTLLGSAIGLLGQSLNRYLPIVQQLGAVMLLIFGLTTLGLFRWAGNQIRQRADLAQNPAAALLVKIFDFFNNLLYTERRLTDMHQVSRGWGYLSSSLLGVSFSAGWIPCVGPILASIFFLASNTSTAGQGALLLAIYSLGLGIPFLITGAAFSRTTKMLRRINRHARIVSIVSGIFLLYVAYLLWSDSLVMITNRFFFLNEWVFNLEEQLTMSSGTGGDIIGMSLLGAAPFALLAGLISFLSPCVLPLVPAYIGYLSGAAVSGNK